MIDVGTAPRPPRLRMRLKVSRGGAEIAEKRSYVSVLSVPPCLGGARLCIILSVVL